MLKPHFSERVALDTRDRIIEWLQTHFQTSTNWILGYTYTFPVIRDFATSGAFDDLPESVFLRVLKDMNNFGTLTLQRDRHDPSQASQTVVLCHRLLVPFLDGATLNSLGRYTRGTVPLKPVAPAVKL